jgi:hypothetical protein
VFYSGGYASASPAIDTNKIERLFLQYKGADQGDAGSSSGPYGACRSVSSTHKASI